MSEEKSKKTLEKFLGLFTEVKPGEGITAISLTVNLLLVLTSYYIAKVVREPLILSENLEIDSLNIAIGGAELKSYLSALMVFLLIFADPPPTRNADAPEYERIGRVARGHHS